jgi:hypothetical protein
MFSLETMTGLLAAFCTTVANVPQVKKTWRTKRADDLSLKMLVLLMTGLGSGSSTGCSRVTPSSSLPTAPLFDPPRPLSLLQAAE